MELLRSHGHQVALFAMSDARGEPTAYDHNFVPHIDFKAPHGLWKKMQRAGHAIYSTDSRQRMREMIREFRPDAAHVRNIYHHLSPSILWELKAHKVPVIYHLNDFKLLCPSYNLVSKGEVCESCKGGAFWHALLSKCYPGFGSRVTLMSEAYVHRFLGTFRKCVNTFIAPSQFVRDKFVEHGWDGSKFEVLPHFQEAHEIVTDVPRGDAPILYFGRLSAEKGVDDLLRAMQKLPHRKLIIAGDGSQRTQLEQISISLNLRNVEFVGHVGRPQRDALISQSRFTVLPSHAYETLGKTILESYAKGRAVIASDMGSRRELIRDGQTGLLYPTGDVDRLAQSIEKLAVVPKLAQEMGQAGWEFVRQRHAPEEHYRKLMTVYNRLTVGRRRRIRALIPTTEAPPWRRPKHSGSTAPTRQKVPLEQRKLRIAFIGGRGVASKYSGIEAYYEEVGQRLVEMGHEVTVYCRTYFTPAAAEYKGMRLVRLPTIRSKHFETVLHTFFSTAHALTRRYDVVHYHALGPALFSWLPRLARMKTAVTVQGLDWQRKKWGRLAAAVLRTGEKASVRFPDATMVVSRALQDRYRKMHRVQALYIPNGGVLRPWTEPRKILEWGLEPRKYALFLGRFSPEKGCHLLIEAFEQLDTDVKLVMAGASSYCDAYSRELRTHACDRILMLDWVSGSTLDELLTNAMIFVLPSDLEGLSLALLDAMGAGICVLTSDVPENRELVDGAGFTFRRGRSSELAERLQFLIANPAVREAAGKMARKRIEDQYQWQRIATQIEGSYLEMMGRKSAQTVPKKPAARSSDAEHHPTQQKAG